MPDTICNTSPLIALDNIGLLGLLEGVYGRVVVTEEVRNEFGSALPGWIDVVPVQNRILSVPCNFPSTVVNQLPWLWRWSARMHA